MLDDGGAGVKAREESKHFGVEICSQRQIGLA